MDRTGSGSSGLAQVADSDVETEGISMPRKSRLTTAATASPESATAGPAAEAASAGPCPEALNGYDAIAKLAFRLWLERGCPEGSPDVDWLCAERQLRSPDTPD